MVREVDLEGEAECNFVGNAYALCWFPQESR